MSTSEGASDRDITAVLNELIDLVREVKQIEWIAHTGREREVLEELEGFLVSQIDAVARVEVRTGSPLTRMVTPSVRRRVPLGSSNATEAVRERLVPHIRAVLTDIRAHARDSSGAEADFLRRLARDLEHYADELAG